MDQLLLAYCHLLDKTEGIRKGTKEETEQKKRVESQIIEYMKQANAKSMQLPNGKYLTIKSESKCHVNFTPENISKTYFDLVSANPTFDTLPLQQRAEYLHNVFTQIKSSSEEKKEVLRVTKTEAAKDKFTSMLSNVRSFVPPNPPAVHKFS
jgi:hypothetical protein